MKTIITLLALFVLSLFTSAQVQCIKCYNQNARVLTGTNNHIVNGGFENNTCMPGHLYFCPNSINYQCDIVNWACTGGGHATYATIVDTVFSTIVEGNYAAYFGNSFCYACSSELSDTSCISNSDCEVTGLQAGYPFSDSINGYGGYTGISLQQVVGGLITGDEYKLEFWAGGEWKSSYFSNGGLFAVDVGFGNIMLRDPYTPPDSGIGRRFVIVFTAASTTHTIKFTNWGHIGFNGTNLCTELVLDDVRLFKSDSTNNPCANGITVHSPTTIATIYPNPAKGFLQIKGIREMKGFVMIEIRNMLGQVVYHIPAAALSTVTDDSSYLNISALAPGMYFVELTSDEAAPVTRKIVKE